MNPQFDQLIVTGTATLGGTTKFPIINGFVPQLGNEITYLTAANVLGEPNALLSPNLEQVNPNIGFQVIKNATDVRLRFVEKGALQFVDNTGGAVDPTDWHEPTNWDLNRVPVSSDVINLDRTQTGDVQRVEVKNSDAFTYQFTLEDQSSRIELAVSNGRTLSSAVGAMTIGNNARVELNNGKLVSSAVSVEHGGQLSGNGTVRADTFMVTGGTLRPGISVGHLDVEGNYLQGANGTLELSVEGTAAGDFSTLAITGQAELGGTLRIDASKLTDFTPGEGIPIVTAGTLSGTLDSVQTIGNDDVYFVVRYDYGAGLGAGTGAGASIGIGATVWADPWDPGNMVQRPIALSDPENIDAFAMALMNPDAYQGKFKVDGFTACQCGPNNRLDFLSIAAFAKKAGLTQSAVAAAIESYLHRVPEPSTTLLLMTLVLHIVLGSTGRGEWHRQIPKQSASPRWAPKR
jgi:hypothetical protein